MSANDDNTTAIITPTKSNRKQADAGNKLAAPGKDKTTDSKLDHRLECIRDVIESQPEAARSKIIEIALSMLVLTTKLSSKRNGVTTLETNMELYPNNVRISPNLAIQAKFKDDETTLTNIRTLDDLAKTFREEAKKIQVKQAKYELKQLEQAFVLTFLENYTNVGELYIHYFKAKNNITDLDEISDHHLATAALICCLNTILETTSSMITISRCRKPLR